MHESIKTFSTIPLSMPRDRIMSRLGYNRHLTDVEPGQAGKIEKAMEDAFMLCVPVGVYRRCVISSFGQDFVETAEGINIKSASLREMLGKSTEVAFLAATVGPRLIEAIKARFDAGSAFEASVYDATGSESADAALGWIHEFIAKSLVREAKAATKMRFSPGYGDLTLENQKIIYDLLKLDRFGITITERYLLIPEKSVIGIIGIEG
ncbi:MAG: methionine synthase [Planctomycetes bacterium]|nr:methionine synthase [Planctomycetota bacterium]